MTFLVGDAIDITVEIEEEDVSGTILSLLSMKDPDGEELADSEVLVFGTGESVNVATLTWQSSISAVPGKYSFIIQAVNGAVKNYAKGNFFLEAQ